MAGRPPALTALTRFGLGPRPGEMAAIAADPVGFVADQCAMPRSALIRDPDLLDLSTLRLDYVAHQGRLQRAKRAVSADPSNAALVGEEDEARRVRRAYLQDVQRRERDARVRHGITTDAPFVERLVLFWRNHFAIHAGRGAKLRWVGGNFERQAVRPHVLGRFEDLLIAAITHPAMLVYLDNASSFGPNSAEGRRRGVRAPNENLARELLELHTLGVDGGYTEVDIGALARVLTGWVGGLFATGGGAQFRAVRHEPGGKTVLGRHYPDDGPDQLIAVLKDLAAHPATARHVARRFASAFVADAPSPRLLEALEDSFIITEGDLGDLALTLALHDDAWAPPPTKTVPPYEFVLGALRATGVDVPLGFVRRATRAMAQQIWMPPSPAGWATDDGAFLGGDSVLERVDVAERLARRFAPDRDVEALAGALFGDALDPFVAEAVSRAETRAQALTLLLMSPPFHRR